MKLGFRRAKYPKTKPRAPQPEVFASLGEAVKPASLPVVHVRCDRSPGLATRIHLPEGLLYLTDDKLPQVAGVSSCWTLDDKQTIILIFNHSTHPAGRQAPEEVLGEFLEQLGAAHNVVLARK